MALAISAHLLVPHFLSQSSSFGALPDSSPQLAGIMVGRVGFVHGT